MKNLRFAAVGAGFWANYQLAAWKELPNVECVALCDSSKQRAALLAQRLSISYVYDDVEQMLGQEQIDFLDIITPVETHADLVGRAAAHRIPVICQKPMATSLQIAEQMVQCCAQAGVPFFIHENWRWQTPMRKLKDFLREEQIGRPVRARLQFITGFDFLKNQPDLGRVEQLLLADLGVHILDTTRFLFGEARSIYCQTHRVHREIRGEDMATIILQMQNDMTVICELAYSGIPVEQEHFPQTSVFIEGAQGSLELAPDYWIRITTNTDTLSRRYPPQRYAWADPSYEVAQASLVSCNENLLHALQGKGTAETTGEDQLQTARLVWAAYQSAQQNEVVRL